MVHPADIQDRDGGILVFSDPFGPLSFLTKLFADGGHQGPPVPHGIGKDAPQLSVEIVKRSDQARGFNVLSKRWGCGTDYRLAQLLSAAR